MVAYFLYDLNFCNKIIKHIYPNIHIERDALNEQDYIDMG